MSTALVAKNLKLYNADRFCESLHLINWKDMTRFTRPVDNSLCRRLIEAHNRQLERIDWDDPDDPAAARLWIDSNTKLFRPLYETSQRKQFDDAWVIYAYGSSSHMGKRLGRDIIDLFEAGKLPQIGTVCTSLTSTGPLAKALQLETRYPKGANWSTVSHDLAQSGFTCETSRECISRRSHMAFSEGKIRTLFGATMSVTRDLPAQTNKTAPMCQFTYCLDHPEPSKSILEHEAPRGICISVFVSHL